VKKVLVTGKFGYIGSKFKEWIEVNDKDIELEYISLRDSLWKEKDFSKYDAVLHLAGIAHVSRNPKLEEMYYKINRDLTIELAKKSKDEGVNHFIYMSSIIVYGKNSINFVNGVITLNTVPVPNDFYGESKLQAENLLDTLQTEKFKISIIRPPMVYGPNSKGNFSYLLKFSRFLLLLPNIKNSRSIIYIDNLNELMRLIIKSGKCGIFMPKNSENLSTYEIIKVIRENMGKKTYKLIIVPKLLKIMFGKNNLFNKIFGNLEYDVKNPELIKNYNVISFKRSIEEIIKK